MATSTTPLSYIPLEGKSLNALGVEAPTFDGQASLLATSTFVYTLFFIAIVMAAFYRYVYAGTLRIQASESGIRQSNEIIRKVTLGLIGVFMLFILLFTVNRNLVTGDVGFEGLSGTSTRIATGAQRNQPQQSQPSPAQSGSKNYQERLKSHNQTVSRLSPSGITTNHNNAPCTEDQFNQKYPTCTSLAFMREESIQTILRVNGDCHCKLVISGGTEPGHKSHGENLRPFDLQKNAELDAFLKGISSSVTSSGNCDVIYRFNGFNFCDEKRGSNSTWAPHYHVD